MQNRRERLHMEKNMGLNKAEKNMPKPVLEEIKKRKKEYINQLVLLRAQEAENRRINEAAEAWSRQLETLMARGYTREAATELLEKNRQIQEMRNAQKAARKAEKKQGKSA